MGDEVTVHDSGWLDEIAARVQVRSNTATPFRGCLARLHRDADQ